MILRVVGDLLFYATGMKNHSKLQCALQVGHKDEGFFLDLESGGVKTKKELVGSINKGSVDLNEEKKTDAVNGAGEKEGRMLLKNKKLGSLLSQQNDASSNEKEGNDMMTKNDNDEDYGDEEEKDVGSVVKVVNEEVSTIIF